MRRPLCTGVAALALALTGCSGDTAAEPTSKPTSLTPSPSSGVSTPSSASPSFPSARPLPPAKDGTNLAACRDGTCQVRVRHGQRIRFAARFGVGSLRLEIGGTEPMTSLTTGADGGSSAVLTVPPGAKDGESTINDLHIQVLGSDQEAAVLRITT